LDVPLGVVTVTLTEPAGSAGEVAVIDVLEFTVKLVAATPPKLTAVAPVKLVPVMPTLVPPAVVPLLGESEVIDGAAVLSQVNWSADEVDEVPLLVVTVIWTVPADPAGAVAVMLVSETMVKAVALVVPNFTAVAPVKPVPVTVTTWPPAVLPVLGLTALTAGAEPVTLV
jgi:hypothetical protein